MFAAVIKCLNRHDCGMHDARPDREGNQAAVFCRIPCGDRKMPRATRGQADRSAKGNSGDDKHEFKIALSNLVVHHVLLSATPALRVWAFAGCGMRMSAPVTRLTSVIES